MVRLYQPPTVENRFEILPENTVITVEKWSITQLIDTMRTIDPLPLVTLDQSIGVGSFR